MQVIINVEDEGKKDRVRDTERYRSRHKLSMSDGGSRGESEFKIFFPLRLGSWVTILYQISQDAVCATREYGKKKKKKVTY